MMTNDELAAWIEHRYQAEYVYSIDNPWGENSDPDESSIVSAFRELLAWAERDFADPIPYPAINEVYEYHREDAREEWEQQCKDQVHEGITTDDQAALDELIDRNRFNPDTQYRPPELRRHRQRILPVNFPPPPTVREFLAQRVAQLGPVAGQRYNSLEQYVLEHGEEFEIHPEPPFPKLPYGWCYYNASLITRADKLTYCEGFALLEGDPWPALHAWNLDSAARVIDRTWGDRGREYVGLRIALEDLALSSEMENWSLL